MFTDREVGPYFNRVGGIDGRFKLNSNWVAAFQGVVSSTLCSDPQNSTCTLGTYLAGPAAEVTLQRDGRKLNYFMDYSDRSDGFRTFTGFDPQPDIHNLYHRVQYSFRPEGKHLISWGPQMEVYHTFDHEGNYLNSGYIPALKAEFVGQTFVKVFYAKEMELLRPEGFQHSDAATRSMFAIPRRLSSRPASTGRSHFIWTTALAAASTMTRPITWRRFLAGRTSVNTTLTVRPTKSLRIDNTYLLFRLHNRLGPSGSMNNHIIRSKWNYQYNRETFIPLHRTVRLRSGQPCFYLSGNHQEFQCRFSDHVPAASQHRVLRRLQQQSGECTTASGK